VSQEPITITCNGETLALVHVEAIILQTKPKRGADGKLWKAQHPTGAMIGYSTDGRVFWLENETADWEQC